MNTAIIASFIIYFCILIGISLVFYRRIKTADAFGLGNRSVNYWVTAVATQASDMGSWLFLVFPGLVYAQGLFAAWVAIGLVVGMILTWHFIAPQLRKATETYNSTTLSAYFNARYHDHSGLLRLLGAFASLFFFTFYIAANLKALGELFQIIFGTSYINSTIIALLFAALYTLIGGFLAVAWCDFFQGMFLLVMIVLVPVYAYTTLDNGWHTIALTAAQQNIPLSLFSSWQLTIQEILLALGWGLGYFGQPHIISNFMGINDANKIRAAKYIGITWQILVLAAATAIGLIGIGYFQNGIANKDLIFITMTTDLFFPLLAGFILCGIMAATLSTVDSHILISGSVIAQDIYQKFLHPQASAATVLFLSRAGALLTSLTALVIAWTTNSSINDLVIYAWSGLGSSFGPLMLTSLHSHRITRTGAIAGLLSGALTAGIWPYLGTSLLPLVPGFIVSTITLFSVSHFTKKTA